MQLSVLGYNLLLTWWAGNWYTSIPYFRSLIVKNPPVAEANCNAIPTNPYQRGTIGIIHAE